MGQPYQRLEDGSHSESRWRFPIFIVVLILLFFSYWTVDLTDGRGIHQIWIGSKNYTPVTTMTPVLTTTNITETVVVDEKDVRFRRRPETAHVDCKRAINGDKDYEFIEDEVRSLFHPENLFCFVLDSKALPEFKLQIEQLTKCFPNVFLVPKSFDVDGSGYNMNSAHMECLSALNKKSHWEYVLLLQNHDVVIRTPYELAAIYKEMRGANDVEITPCPEGRWNKSLNWDARSLKLVRKESAASPTQLNATLRFAKGAVQASLSRETVRWMIETIDLTKLIEQFNSNDFGVDEQLIQSLQISDELEMPGRFTHKCLEKGHNTAFVSRMSHWAYSSEKQCATRTIRHSICLLGLEDLPSLSKYPYIMANKFLPDFDYAGVECIHELIFNRTHLETYNFDSSLYGQMVNVQYHKKRKETNREPPLECVPKKQWKEIKYP